MFHYIFQQGRETPSNDECTSAIKRNAPFSELGTTTGATPDFQELYCNTIDDVVRGVWYEYAPTENNIITVEISSPSFIYFRVQIFSGNSCDAPRPACDGYFDYNNPSITFQAESTEKYFILVTGFSTFDQVGTFTISVEVCHCFVEIQM